MSNHQDDLDLLLSLQDRVLETPPSSPSKPHSYSPGYLSDDGSPRQRGDADMSVFRNVVQDCLDYETKHAKKNVKSKGSKDVQVEKFSGLRIRNSLFSREELSERLSDIRFVRLSTIKNLLAGDTLSGCWATVGVLIEKGVPRTSSIGQEYSIWKIGCLTEDTVSLFLFGDAYKQNRKEEEGTVFALFNGSARKDSKGQGFSLSLSSANQILKIGTSADYGVCEGKRTDGVPCTLVINKRRGKYCQYHKSKASERYTTQRTELKGGNLRMAFRDHQQPEGIYVVKPLAERTNSISATKPVKVMSVEGLKQALRNADKVTTNTHSQGMRFLKEVTGKISSKVTTKPGTITGQKLTVSENRKSFIVKKDLCSRSKQLDVKRRKTEPGVALKHNPSPGTGKTIELEIVTSDEEI
ncbi:hypothetical protein SLA2020_169020 [Shorea laevis]